MTWAHIAAPLFAWASGVLFWASVRPARPGRRQTSKEDYGAFPADSAGLPGWVRQPRILFQLVLLAAFVIGALILIVLSV